METDELLTELHHQGEVLQRTAGTADLQAPVPSCPGWTTADLLAHLVDVERRVAWIVRGGDPAAFSSERPGDADLAEEFTTAVTQAITLLRSARDTLSAWTPRPVDNVRRFWVRRQAHELAIHRVDLQLAVGFGVDPFEPEFAADGIDELLIGLRGPGPARPAGAARLKTVALTPLDANSSWLVGFGEHTVHCRRGTADSADLSVFAMASELYRWAWNRAGDDEVSLSGDVTLADRWRRELVIGGKR